MLELSKHNNYFEIKANGIVTHEDYLKIIPQMEKILKNLTDKSVNVIFDATNLEKYELEAAFDDLKFGLKYENKFNKLAVVGHQKWLEVLTQLSNYLFINGEMKYFDNYNDAFKWLQT